MSLFLLPALFPVPLRLSLHSSDLHVSLQLKQMETVPGDESRALVGEIHTSKAGLARPQVRLADRVVMAPDEVVVNGDVLALWGVAVGAQNLLVPKGSEEQMVWTSDCVFSPVHCVLLSRDLLYFNAESFPPKSTSIDLPFVDTVLLLFRNML